jgi:hypothetical protein
MTETAQNFELYAGEDKTIEVTVSDVVDLSGSTITYKMATTKGGASVVIKTSATDITSTLNVISIPLPASDTASLSGRYYYQITVVDTDSDSNVVTDGTIYVYPIIT